MNIIKLSAFFIGAARDFQLRVRFAMCTVVTSQRRHITSQGIGHANSARRFLKRYINRNSM